MALSFTVGGARGMFERSIRRGSCRGSRQRLWRRGRMGRHRQPMHYGELADTGWTELQRRAIEELGHDTIPNLAALGEEGRGVYVPAQVQAVSLPLSAGAPLKCASLLGLRNELAALACRWDLPLDDVGLHALLRVAHDPDDGWVADPTEILTFARLALAANEAMRRDCPLWLVGS